MSEAGFERVMHGVIWLPENDGQPYHVTEGDAGGATAWGVTYATWAAWRADHRLPAGEAQFVAVTQDELLDLYHVRFWQPAGGDYLPVGADLISMEIAVGSGPAWPAMLLHRALAMPDSFRMTQQLLQAAAARQPADLILRLTSAHLALIEGIVAAHPGNAQFRDGWIDRIDRDWAIADAWVRAEATKSPFVATSSLLAPAPGVPIGKVADAAAIA